LIYDIFFILIGNIYKYILIEALDPLWYYRLYKRKQLKKEANCNKAGHSLNQTTVNSYFEGSPLDMGKNYASIIKILFLTVFYGPLLPIAYPIGMVALSIMYWVHKYTLLRRNNRPFMMGKSLIRKMVGYLELLPLLYMVSFSLLIIYVISLEQSSSGNLKKDSHSRTYSDRKLSEQ